MEKEDRDSQLAELLHEVELTRRQDTAIQRKLEDTEAQAERIRQDLETARQIVSKMKTREGFDPQQNDDQLEQYTKEVVHCSKILSELEHTERELEAIREQLKASGAERQEIIHSIRAVYEKYGWD